MTDIPIVPGISDGARLGEGVFPIELDRLNIGAVLLAPMWSLFYRQWWWSLGFFALIAGQIVVMSNVDRVDLPAAASLVVLALCRVAILATYVAFGFRANRLVWEREKAAAARESGESHPRLAVPVSHYSRIQRRWMWWGIGLLVYTYGSDFWAIRTSVLQDGPKTLVSLSVWATAIAGSLALGWVRRHRRSAS